MVYYAVIPTDQPTLPLYTRWCLAALGLVQGGRIRSPVDPVAAWIMRVHPGLRLTEDASGQLGWIRSMTSVVDALLSEEIGRAQSADNNLCLWLVGGGFDARWFRMMRTLSGVVAEHVEVESAEVLQAKSRILGASQYDQLWRSIRTQPGKPEEWTVSSRDGLLPVVVLQSCWKRMSEQQFFRLLARVAEGVPGGRVVIDLPGEDMKAHGPWISNSMFRELGFVVETDIRVRSRPNLLSRRREQICGGMEGYRVVRLEVGRR